MDNNIILTPITIEELKSAFKSCIREELKIAQSIQKLEMDKKEDNELLTIQQVSKHFKVSKVTIHAWIKKGILKPIKKSSRTYFLKTQVIDELNKQ